MSSSSSQQSQSQQQRSIWAPSRWNFTFNLGREPGTLMSPEWGASGKRLIFDGPVEATSDLLESARDNNDAMLQRNANALLPLSGDDDFFLPGEWKIQMPRGIANGKAGKLMCYLDLKAPLRKDDIYLDEGERIYMTAKCWGERELDRALERLTPYSDNYRLREEKMNVAVSEQRLGYERLIIDHENALREYQEANIYFPTINDDDEDFSWTKKDLEWEEGPWPGESELLTIEPLFLMVRRMKFFVKEEYHVIGTWAAVPMMMMPSEGEEEEEQPAAE
eukprot:CAMPEP_0197180170 /NCGR_PEP_ID=MMETSP1423-20130617/4871_1 /TAXON_ID=476441 /ORGANISM="Pseudo-nitzschia heimii, Strain UNC1101" /LENGTH=277 /DNA_ID=CAMNT_0042630201 /DNA_START=299 /DNA_END=1132 /DNA_ORIENTATION=+